jgi:hypothetical protein
MAKPKTAIARRMKMMPQIRIPSAAQGHADKAQPYYYAASPISTNLVPEGVAGLFPAHELDRYFQSRDKKSPARAGLMRENGQFGCRTIVPRAASPCAGSR